ncbi:mevalonate kinase-like [Ptychodera flava]|uniref:mevalonate kinase-like n=1 Tax=Ptychodera flava TaxID=63121 RepID=UPI00396A7DE8
MESGSGDNGGIVISAPGKVILHGEHAVVYGKVALAVSLNLRTYLELKDTENNEVRLDLPDIELHRVWKLEDMSVIFESFTGGDITQPGPPTSEQLAHLKELAGIKKEEDSEVKYLAVIAFLYIYLGICSHKRKSKLPSLCLRVNSNLPTGAGLGSSAAFSVCLASSLLTYCGAVKTLDVEKESHFGRWSQENLETINNWAYEAERIIHGTPSGIDNSISTYGGAINFRRITDKDGKVTPKIVPLERVPLLRILLVNTKVPRSTKVLVANVRKKLEKYPDIIGPILDSIEGIANTCEKLFADSGDNNDNTAAIEELEELIDINQHHLASIGVSHPALQQVCQISAKYGLHCKLTGAGGGGCAVTLLRKDTSQGSIDEIQKELKSIGFDCWETSIGGPGVTLHRNIHRELSEGASAAIPKALLEGL